MTSNMRTVPQNQAFAARNLGRAIPLTITLLVWLFAATFETGYVAVLSSGFQQTQQANVTT